MKKILMTICLTAAVLMCRAGGVLTISDLCYSDAHGSWGVEIRMDFDNSDMQPEDDGGIWNICAMQFDVTIPSQFGFVPDGRDWKTVRAGGVDDERVEFTTALRSERTLRLVVVSTSYICREAGPVVFVPVTPESGFTPSVGETFKVNLTNQVLVSSSNGFAPLTKTYPAGVIGDGSLSCYDSKGVRVTACGELEAVEAAELVNDVATYNKAGNKTEENIVSIDLSRCTSTGLGRLRIPEGANTMVFAASEGQVDNVTNVFVEDGNGVWRCKEMVLSDDYEKNPVFELLCDNAVADKFSYTRQFAAGQKSTVVLPVTLTKEQTTALRTKGMSLLRMTKYDDGSATDDDKDDNGGNDNDDDKDNVGDTNVGTMPEPGNETKRESVTFSSAETFEANTPYVISLSADAGAELFKDLENVTLSSTAAMMPVTSGRMAMHGNYVYQKELKPESSDVVYYGYFVGNPDGDKPDNYLGILGNNCQIGTFRCYLALAGVSEGKAAPRINVREDGSVTAIESVVADDAVVRNAARRGIYTIDGRRVNATDVNALSAGIYVVDGRKVVRPAAKQK
ncbi:MAG: hypothetical protein K2L56_04055 [Prevotella sp.]|nr:hypothetical protein [Prevotella sp.]